MKSSGMPAVLMVVCASAFSASPPGPGAAPQPAVERTQQTAATVRLGRLFFTPAERAEVDESRRHPAAAAEPQTAPLPPAPEYVTLDGVVRRSDGITTVWVNNHLLEGKRTDDGLEVTDSKRTTEPGHIIVRVPQVGRSVDMRVGQRLDVDSGRVQERYQLKPTDEGASPEATAPATEPSAPKPTLRESSKRGELPRESEGPSPGSEPPAAGQS